MSLTYVYKYDVMLVDGISLTYVSDVVGLERFLLVDPAMRVARAIISCEVRKWPQLIKKNKKNGKWPQLIQSVRVVPRKKKYRK